MTAPGRPADAPFLSVLVPVGTAGDQALRETLLCLMGQDDTDFEVIVVVPDDEATATAARAAVEDQPPRALARMRAVRTSASTPGAVRNAALAEAHGRYVTVLPEGDLPLGSWVRSFHHAEASAAGRLVRALGVAQEHSLVEVAGRAAVRAQASPRSESPEHFSLWQHALEPLTMPSAWAWPRALADAEGVAYDAGVVDDADWELLVRLAQLVGVLDLGVVTSLHRDWPGTITSETDVTTGNGRTARDVLDGRPLVLPPGEIGRLRAGAAQGDAARELTRELESRAELIRLKDDHIRNVEAQLDDRDTRIERLRERLARRTAQVEKLRTRASRSAPVEEIDAHDPAKDEDPEGHLKRRGRFLR